MSGHAVVMFEGHKHYLSMFYFHRHIEIQFTFICITFSQTKLLQSSFTEKYNFLLLRIWFVGKLHRHNDVFVLFKKTFLL